MMPHTFRITLHSYTRDSPLLDAALDVFARVWPERDREVTRANFTGYTGFEDFHGLVAKAGDEYVGVALGARSRPGRWWHDQVTPVLGLDHPALQDAWRLMELAVIESHQGQGIGGLLHDALLEKQPCPRVLLSTEVDNERARRMYERRGWYYVHATVDFPGEPHPYAIMGKEIERRS
jgi:ribosomal protein S18 acetylase RimI-like enzyme